MPNPRPSDIEWTRNLFNRMNDGGFWGIPREQTIYQFDKIGRVLKLVYGRPGRDYAMLAAICPLLGWRIEITLQPLTERMLTESGMGKTLGWTVDDRLGARTP